MTESSRLERQVTEWLQSRATADGIDEVLVASLARAAQVRQERPSLSHSFPGVGVFVRPVIAATALATAIMVVVVSSIPPLPKAASAVVTGVWPTGPDVVFTALLPPDSRSGLYWRGATYDVWSPRDRGWRVNGETFSSVRAGASILEVAAEEPPADGVDAIAVTISPQQESPVVVAPGLPVTVDLDTQVETSGPAGPLVQVNLSGPSASYRVAAIPTTVASRSMAAPWLAAAGTDYPAEIRDRYAKPPGAAEFGPESMAFLRHVRDAAGDDPYEIAVKMVEAFDDPRFTYAVDTRDVDCGTDGFTECFLRARTGYCMYFATSMVMLLRHEGIPARFVEGFLPGSRVGSQVTVRAQDAHSWVEVFFPGYGWVPFDPTPRPRPTTVPSQNR